MKWSTVLGLRETDVIERFPYDRRLLSLVMSLSLATDFSVRQNNVFPEVSKSPGPGNAASHGRGILANVVNHLRDGEMIPALPQ